MSTEALPISPARFAEALRDLSLANLHLKVLELRNDIAHLDYSNEQLLPYARGTAAAVGNASAASARTGSGVESAPGAPDPDCVEAIQENLVVIERRLEQLRLVRVEVEQNRGVSWAAFQSKEEAEQLEATEAAQRAARTQAALAAARETVAGATGDAGATDEAAAEDEAVLSSAGSGNPWTDGTFQTGTIRNGELRMDHGINNGHGGGSGGGGSLSDDQLRRALAERLAGGAPTNGEANHGNGEEDGTSDDEGLHL